MESAGYCDFIGLDSEYQDLVEARGWMDCPEQRLIWAVIERSVRDALGNQSAEMTAAIEWLWKTENSAAETFSFQWCCETLGIDAHDFLEKIMAMRKRLNKSPLPVPLAA